MKKLVILTALFMSAGVICAEEKSGTIWQELRPQTSEAGPQIYFFRYKEPGSMEDKGIFYGVTAAYTYRGWVPAYQENINKLKWMFRAEAMVSWGQVDYDGAYWDGTPAKAKNNNDISTDLRMLLGLDFPGTQSNNTPYIGIAYRYLDDDSSHDPAGYNREANYVYAPIGITLQGQLNSDWILGANAEFDLFITGQQKSRLSDVGLEDIKNRQKSGYGARGSVRIEKTGTKVNFIIEPFIRYWNINDSEIEEASGGNGLEPKNNTTEYGVNLLWKF
jgi:hypothetical protein